MSTKSEKPESPTWAYFLFGSFALALCRWYSFDIDKASNKGPKLMAEKQAEHLAQVRSGIRLPTPDDLIWDDLESKKEWGEKERQQCQEQKAIAQDRRMREQYWQWTDLEARHGNSQSALILASALYQGILLPQDKEKALKWATLAAEGNDPKIIQIRDLMLAEKKAQQATGNKEKEQPKQSEQ